MKILIKISIILFVLITTKANAQQFNMIEASTDKYCNNTTAGFSIKENNKGFFFEIKLIPGWHKCDSTESIDYNMVGIRNKITRTFLYQFYLYHSGKIRESSDLSELILGPGEYELVVSSNRNNSVYLSFFTGTEIAVISNGNKNFFLNPDKGY